LGYILGDFFSQAHLVALFANVSVSGSDLPPKLSKHFALAFVDAHLPPPIVRQIFRPHFFSINAILGEQIQQSLATLVMFSKYGRAVIIPLY
jgi:hypothetical protein